MRYETLTALNTETVVFLDVMLYISINYGVNYQKNLILNMKSSHNLSITVTPKLISSRNYINVVDYKRIKRPPPSPQVSVFTFYFFTAPTQILYSYNESGIV
jgi:hypothetical protein